MSNAFRPETTGIRISVYVSREAHHFLFLRHLFTRRLDNGVARDIFRTDWWGEDYLEHVCIPAIFDYWYVHSLWELHFHVWYKPSCVLNQNRKLHNMFLLQNLSKQSSVSRQLLLFYSPTSRTFLCPIRSACSSLLGGSVTGGGGGVVVVVVVVVVLMVVVVVGFLLVVVVVGMISCSSSSGYSVVASMGGSGPPTWESEIERDGLQYLLQMGCWHRRSSFWHTHPSRRCHSWLSNRSPEVKSRRTRSTVPANFPNIEISEFGISFCWSPWTRKGGLDTSRITGSSTDSRTVRHDVWWRRAVGCTWSSRGSREYCRWTGREMAGRV